MTIMMDDLKLRNNKKSWIPLLFIMFIPLSWATFVVGSVYRNVTLLLMAVFLVAVGGNIIKFTKDNGNTLLIWTVYILYTTASIAWSEDVNAALNNCLGMLLVYVIAWVFAHSDANKVASNYYDLAWILVGVVCALFFLFGSTEIVGDYTNRGTLVIMGNRTDPNEFGGTFAVATSISMYYVFAGKKWWLRVACLIVSIMEFYVILATGSRGALIAVIIAVCATVLVGIKPTLQNLIAMAVVLGVTALAVWYLVLPLIQSDVMGRFSLHAILSDGGSGRASIWKSGLVQYENSGLLRILFGFGYGGIVAEGIYDNTATMHNQFIQILVNYGIVGFAIYMTLLARCFFLIVKNNRKYAGGFIGMMALSMTLSLPPTYKPFWVLLAMACVSELGARRNAQ